MKITYQNKNYEVMEVNGDWRVYSEGPNLTKEEAIEVINAVKQLKNERNKKC